MTSSRKALSILACLPLLAACGQGSETDSAAPGSTEATNGGAAAETCTISLADFDSADVHAAHWAMQNGVVESDLITEVDVDYLALPALIQSTASDRYDVTSTSLSGVVFAAVQGQIDLKVIALKQAQPPGGAIVMAGEGSEVSEAGELVGQTLGVSSLGSTTTMATQIVLEDVYGINADATSGDVSFVELDPPTLLNAVENGDVAAAEFIQEAAFQAMQSPSLTLVLDKAQAYEDLTDSFFIGGAYIIRPETAEEKGDCIREFQRILKESADYYHENPEEVAAELEAQGIDPDFIIWSAEQYPYGATLDQEWIDAGIAFWDVAFEHGFIPESPDPDTIFFQ